MKVLCAVCILFCLTFSTVHAEPLGASLYPAGSVLSVEPALTNDAYDCDWGLDCQSWNPVFHTQSSPLLGRTGGWAEWGHKGKSLYFVLLDSQTTAGPAMLADLQSQLALNHFHRAKSHDAELLPAVSECWRVRSGKDVITIIAASLDGTLIEAAEMHRTTKYTQPLVMGYLVRQVEAAETVQIADAPGS